MASPSAAADTSLKDLPAPALAAVHAALCEVDKEGCSSFHQDAAAFRSTCKDFNASATLPSSLKLHYRHAPPTAKSLMGLKQLLDAQPNACKQLSIYMGPAAKPARPTGAGGMRRPFGFLRDNKPPLQHVSREGLLALAAVDTHLTHLDVPTLDVVTVDPGLQGRKPTPWARTLKVYEEPVPASAVPSEHEYRDEDAAGRERNFERIANKVEKYTKKIFHREMPSGHVSDCLSPDYLELYYSDGQYDRFYFRSDLLLRHWARDKDELAQIVIQQYGDKYAHMLDSSSDGDDDDMR